SWIEYPVDAKQLQPVGGRGFVSARHRVKAAAPRGPALGGSRAVALPARATRRPDFKYTDCGGFLIEQSLLGASTVGADEVSKTAGRAMETSERMILGRITDESIELMRRRIGYPNPTVRPGYMTLPWYTEATYDAIRHFTEGYGDDNPLYTTRDYG